METINQEQIKELLYPLTFPVKKFKWVTWKHGVITQPFGLNENIYSRFGIKGHNGIDWKIDKGDEIYAVQGGTVAWVGNDIDGFGNYLRIHSEIYNRFGLEFIFEWTYAHFQEVQVKFGDEIKAGDKLGLGDSTGFSTGDHLHLGLRVLYIINGAWTLDYNNGFKGSYDFYSSFNFENMPTLAEKLEEERLKKEELEKFRNDFKKKYDGQLIMIQPIGKFGWYYNNQLRLVDSEDRAFLMLASYLHRRDKGVVISQQDTDKLLTTSF